MRRRAARRSTRDRGGGRARRCRVRAGRRRHAPAAAAGEPITFGERHLRARTGRRPIPAATASRSSTSRPRRRPSTCSAPTAARSWPRPRRSAPGRPRRLSVTLAPGAYAWGCDLDGLPAPRLRGRRVTAHRQPGGSGPVVVPSQTGQLVGPMRAYRRYVARRIATLAPQVRALRTRRSPAVGSAPAQAAW